MFMYLSHLLRNKIFELEHVEHIDATFHIHDHNQDMTNNDESCKMCIIKSMSSLF